MASKDEKISYGDLTDVMPEADVEEYSLEEILAEYGGSLEQTLLREPDAAPETAVEEPTAEQAESAPAQPETAMKTAVEAEPATEKEPELTRQEVRDELLARAVDLTALERETPHTVSMEEAVSLTVDAVMEEQETPLLKQPRRGLFSRKELEETETLYDTPEEGPSRAEEPEPLEPEPEFFEAAAEQRTEYRRRHGGVPTAAVVALIPTALMLAEQSGVTVPMWSGDLRFQSMVLLACLAVTALLCRHVFTKAARTLVRRRITGEALIALSALVSAADCAAALLSEGRTETAPYAAVSALALVFAQWGLSRESRGLFDTFRTASLDKEPPYLVTETDRGACKQRGSVPGFYTDAVRDDVTVLWQTLLLPVVLVASFVFAGLSSLGQGRGSDFFLNWSAILAAGGTFALPLCWSIPFSRLARHLQKAGCAVAGWTGAEKISAQRRMILADRDLFPPGTLRSNGVKVIGEERQKVLSYAASMARAADSGLARLFDELLRGENGRYVEPQEFSFFEEGGWSAVIHGESVLLGSASFMRKMSVRLPKDIQLKTGIFLAVDRQLVAVFAVKYEPAENVDYALRLMRRSGVSPLLASRDPNITPALLQRKFHKGVKVEYPDLITRVALSEAENDRGLPRALLFREGLLPYAETVTGSRRLCRGVRRVLALALFGSAAGALLAFYLVSQAKYGLLTPLALEAFLLLWVLPIFLI